MPTMLTLEGRLARASVDYDLQLGRLEHLKGYLSSATQIQPDGAAYDQQAQGL